MHPEHISRCLLLLLVCSALGTPLFPAHAADVVALHPLKGLGVDGETLTNLERIVHNELSRVPSLRIVDEERTRRLVRDHGIECDGADSCLAKLARDLEATVTVYAVVGGLGEIYTISMKVVEAVEETTRSRVELRVDGEREVLIDGIRAGIFNLLRPDLYVGSLQVDMPEEGAEVYVDGALVGVTPLTDLIRGLDPGQRALKIVKTGYRDFDRFIEVRFQRTSVVTIDLEQSAVSDVIYRASPADHEAESAREVAAAMDTVDEHEGVEDDEIEEEAPASALPSGVAPSIAGTGTSPLRLTAGALVGAGSLTLVAGVYNGAGAYSQARELERAFSEHGGPRDSDIDSVDRAYAKADAANLLYVIGGVVTTTGAAVLLVDLLRDRSASAGPPAKAQYDLAVVPGDPAWRLGLTLVGTW